MAIDESTPSRSNTPSLVLLFSISYFNGINQNFHDLVVISVIAKNYIVPKNVVRLSKFDKILYFFTFKKMQIPGSSL